MNAHKPDARKAQRGNDGHATMLQLKLRAPRLPANVVDRPRLTAAVDALSACRLVLLTAPAGFGKTTLLCQWQAHLSDRGQCVAWLSVDEDDGEARRFLAAMVSALDAAGLDMSSLAPRAEIGFVEMAIDAVVRDIVAALDRFGAPVTLILDDYHRAAGDALDGILATLLAALPDGVRLLMSVRRRPDVGVDRLLASGSAVELDSDLLRFTRGESRELLDTGWSDTDLDTLTDRMEGWPVALQLTRLLSLQDHAVPGALARLSSRSGHLWSFLTDQVLQGLSEESVDFLLDTSILERFSPAIADAMRARHDSWAVMRRLEPLQSLLTPIDADGVWFRYHHLFAEYLQGQLRHRRLADVAGLHLRASTAFEQSGMLVEAVRHSSLAGDYSRCADLVEQAGGWRLILFGGLDQLRRLLELIPKAARLSHPRLLIAEAYLNLKLGAVREARLTFDLVATDPPDPAAGWQELDDFGRDVLNVGVLIRTYEDNCIDRAFLDGFSAYRAAHGGDDGLTRGVLLCAGAVTALCLGELSGAEAFARDAMASMRSVNSVLGLNYCFLHAGIACTYRGDLRAAFAYLGRAEAMAAENFGADSGLKAISHTLLAAAGFWRDGRIPNGTADLDDAVHHVRHYDGWFDIYCSGLDTRFRHSWMASDDAAMDAVIAEGASLVAERSLERLAAIVDAQRLLRAGAGHPAALAALAALAERLDRQFPRGCWQRDRACWRVLQDVGFALAYWYRASAPDRAAPIADDLVACARAIGARAFEARGLLLRASVAVAGRRQGDAVADLRRAVEIASDEHIVLPFLEQPGLRALIVELERGLWEHGGRPVEASFLSDVVQRLGSRADQRGNALGLSGREQDVMNELSRGLTNKEIARVLDMTEHTVKFHLKNIFVKLGVDRRAHALALFRSPERQGEVWLTYPQG